MDVIFSRKSVRKYSNAAVEPDKIERILRAAMQAPSAGNQQPWEFIVVRDAERKKKLSKISRYAGCAAVAPVVIVLLGNRLRMMYPQNWEHDMAVCSENIILEAGYLGLGSVWLGAAPEAERISILKEIFSLPEFIIPYNIIPLGYPALPGSGQAETRWNPDYVHYEKYAKEK